ncbi:inhibitor of KinA sporulation pathway (predicted exonuclease) [Murinocardiopsis flavida]|uniref:Inhibitor of KinA sporulation pathway (Predicted exonuclease) n=1 Tax=Murinocardiopsis flavida TaxID=645275 RepID=A0A2P8DU21_9ACTN|nr:3'-5' exonuclease [Murinocardiopsis flavida]PSL00705.1 inhibitor of KinA sporulation pathway (predicted exonuclease) [Murinocardiopsis flavida]
MDARYVNVVDVEATCWRGRPPEGARNEIIEVGLCVVDLAERRRVARDRILVRPASPVSAFCTELTGLTQEEVDGGVDFGAACAALVDRHAAAERAWASWGGYDLRQFREQCAEDGAAYPFSDVHTNAKAVFSALYGSRKRRFGMANALTRVGLPLEGRHHSGADDAWNIGALVLHLVDAGAWPPEPEPAAAEPAESGTGRPAGA